MLCPKIDQWLFLLPAKGGRWHIIPQLEYVMGVSKNRGKHPKMDGL